MTEYERGLPTHIAFPPQTVDMPLGRVIAERNLRQLRMSETEKERFVTYYFNGQREDSFINEDRAIIPSKKIATYDLAPEMSAREIAATLIEKINSDIYDFILVNFANADMVAHTGNLKAAIKAVEVLDECIGQVFQTVDSKGGVLVITADHGNVEEMINNESGEVDTEHSTYPVPLLILSKRFQTQSRMLPSGILADVAPTILKLMEIPKPTAMTGRSLI
jgi:2,3-bisphosphoglycerate-independent phosphoglycerate mutase